MTQNSPTFSICIPAYNAEEYLKKCLDSATNQTFSDYEIVIVDDGSSDRTADICDTASEIFKNIHVIHESNCGPLLARRNAVKNACGDYIVFLDADDMLRSDALEQCFNVIKAKNCPDIIAFDMATDLLFDGSPINMSVTPGLIDRDDFYIVRVASCRGKLNTLCGKAIKRSLFDLDEDYSEYFGMRHGEDFLQMLPIINKATSFFYLNESLYYYRRTDESGTFHFSGQQIEDLEIVSSRVREYGHKWGLDNDASQGILLQYCYLFKILYLDATINKRDKKAAFSKIREMVLPLINPRSTQNLTLSWRIFVWAVKANLSFAVNALIAIDYRSRHV